MSVATTMGAFERLAPIYKGVTSIAVVCTQWGDTGKGKVVDLLTPWADIVARGTGGANAGHTVVRHGLDPFVFHIISVGILYDGEGKVTVIGSGCAVYPMNLLEEIDMLLARGLTCDNLRIALNAHLVLPQHIVRDRLKEKTAGSGRIGTTGRGMGPVYEDHYARAGLVMNDLLNPDEFREKLTRNLRHNAVYFRDAQPTDVQEIMDHEHLGHGQFYDYHGIARCKVEAITEYYLACGERLRRFIADTDRFVWKSFKAGKKILLEGAQGNMLSIDGGMSPYVTSSDCSRAGLAKGVGLKDRHLGLTLGIIKMPYMTRVGLGPFPTEIGGERSEQWCNDPTVNRVVETSRHPDALINSADEFLQGIGIRQAGGEYGATTGRPRRTGWLDLALLRLSKRRTGRNVVFTKADIMDGAEQLKICVAYEYTGPDYWSGQILLKKGTRIEEAIPNPRVMRHCKPIYQTFPGWRGPIRGARVYQDLPQELRTLTEFIERETDINVVAISVGPEPEETVFVKAPV